VVCNRVANGTLVKLEMDLFRYKRKGSSASVGVVLCGVLFAAGTNGFLCVPPRTQQKDPVAPVSGGANRSFRANLA